MFVLNISLYTFHAKQYFQAHHRAVEVNNDKVVYGLKKSEDASFFSIDSQTGQLKNKNAFDREKKHLYTVEVS